jgi:hypothetical protein
MEHAKVTEQCRMWARMQLAAFVVGMLVSLFTRSPWVAAPILAFAFILNIPVFRTAKCPACGSSLIADSASSWRLAPIFMLIAGRRVLCAACRQRETNGPSEQHAGQGPSEATSSAATNAPSA